MDCIIVVAEKPSIADAIAKALASSPIATRADRGVRTHEFQGRYEGHRCEFRVTSVLGHCFSLDFAEAYRDWDACDPAELWDAPVVSVPTSGAVLKNLHETAGGGDALLLFLDCDREGEAIAFQVIDVCQPHLRRGAPIRRATFSAVTAADITRAMQNLGEPDAHLAEAVLARQELDLRVGVAFTRFATKHFLDKYALLDARLLSYGPCQTPTLGFVVQREDEIATFAPEPFWVVGGEATIANEVVDVAWDRGRCFDHDVAAALARSCGTEGIVAAATERTKVQPPPLPFNTVELLKTASKVLRLSPAQTMRHAEHLYLDGYLSYPRTETNTFPRSFDVEGVLRQQAQDERWGAYARRLLDDKTWARPRRGTDAGDHPPITPTAPFDGGGAPGRLYELVARRFLAAVSPDATRRAQEVVIRDLATGETFTFAREVLLAPGFLEVLQKRYDAGDGLLGRLPAAGDAVPLRVDAVPRERRTTPPGHLTEAECIALMERHGIGTDASISSHIENVCKRNYVRVDAGRRLRPTTLGLALAHGFALVDASLVRPAVRAQIEQLCDVVARGAAPRGQVVAHALEAFAAKFAYFAAHVAEVEVLFDAVFDERPEGDRVETPFARDGPTGQYLFKRGRRLFAPATKEILQLPMPGAVANLQGARCPACRSELLRYTLCDGPGSHDRMDVAYPLCARCFDAVDGGGEEAWGAAPPALCLECPLPDGHPALGAFLVARDARDIFGREARGAALLEPARAGAKTRPRLVSTRPPIFVGTFHASVRSVAIAGPRLRLAFAPGESPLDQGAGACTRPPTDPLVKALLAAKQTTLAPAAARGRGKGRGGRDGRGKGRRGGGKGKKG